jgi:hypothetical protein
MTLSVEYFLSSLIANVAVIQLAAIRSGLLGLLFSQNQLFNRITSIVALVIPAALFFTWNARNPTGIIEGAQQAGLFSLAVLSAGSFTFIMSSLVNHPKFTPPVGTIVNGIESLKQMTFFQAIRIRYWRT